MLELNLSNRKISTKRPAFVMGIVNCTPDSFFPGSRGGVELAKRQIECGADIIDIGGESTRPGTSYLDAEEEISRMSPVIKAVRQFSDIPISVDTRKLSVMKAAFEAGADILNDVSALEDDPQLAEFAASTGMPVMLMHKRGIPETMQNCTEYADVFNEVSTYLEERARFALECGVKSDRIIVDPGIGFGKDLKANAVLIARCGELCGGKYPVLMALSRKSCIGQMTGAAVGERLSGTIAADLFAVAKGASFVRVHDVKECVDSLAVYSALKEVATA